MPEPRPLPSTLRAAVSAALAVPIVLAAVDGAAQEPISGGFALNRYEPTPTGDRFYAVPSGGVDGKNLFRLGLTLEYVDEPLVLRDTCRDLNNDGALDGSTECNLDDPYDLGAVVSDQLIAHVGMSYALFSRLLVSMDLPLYLLNTGDDVANPRAPNTIIAAPDGSSVGDLRLGLRGQLFGQQGGLFELGVGAYFWIPTGGVEEFSGDDSVRFMPHLTASGRRGKIVYAAQAGVNLRESTQFVNVDVGTELTYGVAAGLLVAGDRVTVGPELYGSTGIEPATPFKGRTTHLELLGGARYRMGEFSIGGAIGTGLTHGMGSPQFRAIANIAFAPGQADADGDGITDREDACPQAPGSPSADKKKNGCPPDQDGDGVIDAQDACPTQPGAANPDPSKNGCPGGADRDGDSIADGADACPDQPGAANPDPARNGCPGDRDGDSVADTVDACPDVAGPANNQDPKRNGCPPDRDLDTVQDAQDACPDTPGSPNPDPALNGCPGDKDGDTIRDDQDACPAEKGAPDPDPKQNGCPKLVRVTQGAIKILQQVQFQLASAQILPASDALLNEVAAVLKDHPEIKKVRVDGHTDDKGPDDVNMRLSAERARAVKIWLVEHGIEETRLESAGFGETKPIGDNKTEQGAQQNRRVEFNILEPAPPEPAPEPPAQPTLPPPPKKAAPAGQKPASVGVPPTGGQAPAGGGTKAPATSPGGQPPPSGQPPAGGQKPAGTQAPAAGAPPPKPPATGAPTAPPKPSAAPSAAPTAPKTP